MKKCFTSDTAEPTFCLKAWCLFNLFFTVFYIRFYVFL